MGWKDAPILKILYLDTLFFRQQMDKKEKAKYNQIISIPLYLIKIQILSYD